MFMQEIKKIRLITPQFPLHSASMCCESCLKSTTETIEKHKINIRYCGVSIFNCEINWKSQYA